MSLISQKHLQNEEAAYKWVEARIWPNGAQCPHCFEQKRVSKMEGKATRFGLYKCYACRKQFRVTVGTIFEKSHVPLHLWLQAFYLVAGSKKGISANQLHRTLGVTLKTAWFMGHRIREAMRSGSLMPPMGGEGEVVEVDETVYGRASTHPKGRPQKGRGIYGSMHKNVILSLVERGGSVRSYHVAGSTVGEVVPIIKANVSRETSMMTDSAQLYKYQLMDFASHDRVHHERGEYVRYVDLNHTIHTNTVEGYFSVFKRGMRGTYQHCKEKHLHRYLAEFDFRYNNRIAVGVTDEARAALMVKGAQGKRLTYRTTGRA
ncbi:IS1595 family transposase [Hyphomicrobium sp.]|uniref:IS1595 family transposase n=1 Tax=Hyphomicrobium sp. TaxID=82 RepID=UPI000FAC019C|nr:IS1595 family transposase [Hyphomicrobium sp.]RUO98558.1 MAG: IS1595 family transposase [Hyphomicrobium sp.]